MEALESQGESRLLMVNLKLTLVMLVFIGGGVENYLVKCFIGRGCLSHWSTKLLGKVYEQSSVHFGFSGIVFAPNLFLTWYASAGRRKIPTILYTDGSQFARRFKYIAWRAAVEMAENAAQLILQVISSPCFGKQ